MTSSIIMVPVLSVVWLLCVSVCWGQGLLSLENSSTCKNVFVDEEYDPSSPLVLCCLLPEQFYQCEEPREANSTEDGSELGVCSQFGGVYFEEVEVTSVNCSVLEGVRCYGDRSFMKDGVPCVRYNGHYFPSILLYSVFLGILGVDRFCLGYTCLGVAKLLTLGAVGVWWVVDVILLLTGSTTPNGGYSWEQFY